MRKSIKSLSLIFILFIISAAAFGQSKKDLEKKKKQLQADIEYTSNLLDQTKNKKAVSLNQLVTLNKKISTREELITTFSGEMNSLDHQVGEAMNMINGLEKSLKNLKDEYAKLIYFAYKNQGSYNRLMFLFASKDFNQAYSRIKYLREYTAYRKKQKDMILATKKILEARIEELAGKRTDKQKLLTNENIEKSALDLDKGEQLVMLNTLQTKEKQLRDELKEKQKATDKLNQAIEDIIHREIEAERARAAAAAAASASASSSVTPSITPPSSSESNSNFSSTPEGRKLSDDFSANAGSLSWPVEQGVITETFGRHEHPVLHEVYTNNNGVNIATKQGSMARSVFDGTVTGIVVIPGSYKAIIVRHGDFLTVYSNLEEVNVKMGEAVKAKQTLGIIHTNDEDSKTELHFEVWRGTIKMDPSAWLAMRR